MVSNLAISSEKEKVIPWIYYEKRLLEILKWKRITLQGCFFSLIIGYYTTFCEENHNYNWSAAIKQDAGDSLLITAMRAFL